MAPDDSQHGARATARRARTRFRVPSPAWVRASAGAALLLAACGPGAPRSAPHGPFRLDYGAFGTTPPPAKRAFDLVSSDLDRDGDPDLLVNWHNTGRLELFENEGGAFRLANPHGGDQSGLYENRGLADLYADSDAMIARVRERGTGGVHVWHGVNAVDNWDVETRDGWNLFVVPGEAPVRLELTTNCALELDLDERAVRRLDAFSVEVELAEPTHFRTRLASISTQLVVETGAPVYVGAGLEPAPGPRVELWKDDVHGMAWVHVAGSPEPDLFLTRGGLRGALRPPHDPKRDPFFVYAGGEPLYDDRREAVPVGYGRGRRVEWVDLDGDLAPELYVGNTETPNALFEVDSAGGFRDLAPELGLDFDGGEAFAWVDVDDDGRDDLVLADGAGFRVAFHRGGRAFDLRPGAELGLVLPAGSGVEESRVIDSLSLFVVDQDADGRLDLWLTGHTRAGAGSEGDPVGGAHGLYRRTAAGAFQDVTQEVGLAGVAAALGLVLGDFDNDGDVDAFSIGWTSLLLENHGGARFEALRLGVEAAPPANARGVALDADGDGRLDVALMGNARALARNRVEGGGAALSVSLWSERADPVGALVTAVYRGGARLVQRYGSAGATRCSQGVLPLHFGVAAGDRIERLEVRWPDGATEVRELAAGERRVELGHPR